MQDSKMILIWNKIVVGAQTGNTRLLNEADKELREYFDSEISKAKGEVLKEVKNRFGGSVLLEASGGKIVKKTPPLDSWLQSELDKLSKKNKCSGK